MDRAHWQALAEERLVAAQVLLAAQRWSSAYYLAGYAVECGLKSCILVRVIANPKLIFEDKQFSVNCWSHDLKNLVKQADLTAQQVADMAANPLLGRSWQFVDEWNEKSRYQQKTRVEAEDLYAAITHEEHGVMPWIRLRW